MELGAEVAVQDRVDVLQVVSTRVLVQRIWLGVGPVPTATTAASRLRGASEDRGGALRATHQLCHHGIAVLHLIS